MAKMGLILLMHHILRFSVSRGVVPVTYLIILLQVLIFVGSHSDGSTNKEKCATDVAISVQKVLFDHEFNRLVFAGLHHIDDWHLYFNMISFLSKGFFLESVCGSLKLLAIIIVFTPLVSAIIVAVYFIAAVVTRDASYFNCCGVGFSGVIFALKVLTTKYWRKPYTLLGVEMMSPSSVWIELVLISLIAADVSFLGHFSGILVGLLYVYGPIESIVDAFCNVCSEFVSKCSHSINQRLFAKRNKKENESKNVCNLCSNHLKRQKLTSLQ